MLNLKHYLLKTHSLVFFIALLFKKSEMGIKYSIICIRYEGLSEKFLSSPVPKLLLLAGTDRLDRFFFELFL